MARSRFAAVTDTMRSGLEDVSGRAGDIAQVIAERVGEAIETAGDEGRRLTKQLGGQLSRRWRVVDKTSRENPYYLALGALAVGVAIGYLLSRDRSGAEAQEAPDEERAGATEMPL
jgi:ElaB/YqjD/DUF883 family membrane-anchored ribosome-binding protein